MGAFQKAFEDYGADYTTTLSRFMGNEATYLKFLRMFFEDPSLRKLGAALETGDLSAAFDAAHTLKGVAGNMGLTPLYDAVCKIVEPLRAGEKRDDYTALYQNIQMEFQKAEALRDTLKGGE